jgi:hypothetical protein
MTHSPETERAPTRRGPAAEYRWLRWPGVALALLGVAMILGSPLLAGHKAYSSYVECKKDSYVRSHFCFLAGGPAYAALTDHRRDGTPYTLCVTNQDGARRCMPGRTGTADETKFQSTGVQEPGVYLVTWHVRGREVQRWRFSVYTRPATH